MERRREQIDRDGNYRTSDGSLLDYAEPVVYREASSRRYRTTTAQDVTQYALPSHLVPVSRRSRESMLDAEERRRGGPVTTRDDQRINMTQAYQLPRYKQPEPIELAKQPISRRKFLYLLGGGCAAIAFGASIIKSKPDDIAAREDAGQFGFTVVYGLFGHRDSRANPTELSVWLNPKYQIIFEQANGGSDKQEDHRRITIPISHAYNGPLAGVLIQFAFQIGRDQGKQYLTLSVTKPFQESWEFDDNGTFFVAQGE